MNVREWNKALGQCTPAEMLAWVASLALNEREMRHGPGAALARLLGVHRNLGDRYIAKLVQVGALKRAVGSRALTRSHLPDGGVKIGNWQPANPAKEQLPDPCFAHRNAHKTGGGPAVCIICASGRILSLNHVAHNALIIHSSKPSSSSPLTIDDKGDPMPDPRAISELKKIAKTYAAPVPKKRAVAAAAADSNSDALYVAELYCRLRQRYDPDYSPGSSLRTKALELVAALQRMKVNRSLWGRYVSHAFACWQRMKDGDAVLPVRCLAADSFLDSFTADLGRRRYDLAAISRRLAGAGFDLSLPEHNPALVTNLAMLYRERDPSEEEWVDPKTWAAASWLRGRLSEIPYVS